MKRSFVITDDTREQFNIWSKRILISLILLFIFSVALGGLSHKTTWRIERIDISDASVVSEDEIRSLIVEKLKGNYFFVYARDNSWIFPKSEIKKTLLEAFPRLKEANLSRSDDHTIVVKVSERKPYALWCAPGREESIGDCWFVDETGFLFDKAPLFSEGVYRKIYGGLLKEDDNEPLGLKLPYERFVIADTFTKKVSESVGKVSKIILKGNSEMEFVIHESTKFPFLLGVTVRFVDESKPEILLKRLITATETQFPNNIAPQKKLLYIDMRFGDKVIFGFENS